MPPASPDAGPPAGVVPAVPPATPSLRLSPKVLLTDPIRMLPSLFLPLAGVLFLGGFSPGSFVWAALGIAGSVVYSAVRWATFTYQVIGDRLELTRALVSRSVRTIPLERIRGVDVSHPPLHRLLGIAVLRIDTGAGGDDKQEGELDGVTVAEAERLKAVLLWHARARIARRAQSTREAVGKPTATAPAPGTAGAAGESAGPGTADRGAEDVGGVSAPVAGGTGPAEGRHEVGEATPERVFLVVPRKWLVYGPLSGAYLLTPFALVAGAVGAAFQWGGELGLARQAVWSAGEWLWARPLLLAAALAVLLLAMPVVGVVMYAVFNWDFTLRAREGYLVAERGLVTRRSVSLERRRIRGFELVEGLVERRTGMARAWAIVTGLGDSQTRGQLLPVVPRTTALDVVGEAVGPIATGLRSHPPTARRRRLFRAVFPWLVVAACAAPAAVAWSGPWWGPVVAALLLAGLGIPLGLDRYRSLGHAYDGSRLSVRSGSLRRSQAVVERRAVVGWTLSQTWFQRRAGLLTVTAGVGAGSGGYAALDVGEAEGVAFVAEVTPDWLAAFLAGEDPAVHE
ncbi:PH domain-containing protein [Planomonospora sp. ID67723]|uniref:PH domain-containing protein n=1 Tax=Planomonospora sp. ID67723 TaxID=2738134 RepID=UPI0027DC6E93|nr:PH domain-containing protein [Planomonospora sp. ID67723]